MDLQTMSDTDLASLARDVLEEAASRPTDVLTVLSGIVSDAAAEAVLAALSPAPEPEPKAKK